VAGEKVVIDVQSDKEVFLEGGEYLGFGAVFNPVGDGEINGGGAKLNGKRWVLIKTLLLDQLSCGIGVSERGAGGGAIL